MLERKTVIPARLSLLFFFAVTLAAPFYLEDGYFNLLQAKAHICDAALGAFLAGMALHWGWTVARAHAPPALPRLEPLDWAMLLFGALALASCLCSDRPAAALWGLEGWGVGGFAMAGLALACCLLSRSLPYRQNLWLPVLAVNLVIFFLTILHAAGIDALGLHREVVPDQWFYYLSTIGNRNWYAGYLCLLVPMVAVFYLTATQTASQWVCLLFLAPACLNLVLCASDSVYLGLGFCLFFALPFLTANGMRMGRSCLLMSVYGASLLTVRFLPPFGELALQINGLSGRLLHPAIGCTLTAAGALGVIFLPGLWDRRSPAERRRLLLLLEVLLALVALGFLAHAVTHFGDKWGTNRGRTWRYSLELYRSFPMTQKLLGVGPEQLGRYYRELSVRFTRPILSAHSEPIQLLLSNGALGLLSWGTIWGMLFYCSIRERVWEQDAIAFFLPLTAYFAQGLVNGPQPLNTALLCLMSACFRIHTEKRPEGLKYREVSTPPSQERKLKNEL